MARGSGCATSGSPRAASRGGRPPRRAAPSNWPLINSWSCSPPAIPPAPARSPTGGRSAPGPDPLPSGVPVFLPPLLPEGGHSILWRRDVLRRADAADQPHSHLGGRRMPSTPQIIDVSNAQLEEVLHRVEQSLDEEDVTLIRAVFQSYLYVTDLVEDKNTSLRRLRQLLFGERTEKTDAVVGQPTDRPEATRPRDVATGTGAAAAPGAAEASGAAATGTARPGHGRNGADAYRGAERAHVAHPSLKAGDPCPACEKGTVYDKAPGVLVRITGQPPLAATIYQLQKLRCHLCGQVFTAPAPAEAGSAKYDATAGSMIALLKYGSGMPFNRLEGLQGYLEIPLPASTQWDIVQAVAADLAPAFAELIRQAAQGEVLHNDDTTVKILELMGDRARQEALAGAATDASDSDERSGLFTSGVV